MFKKNLDEYEVVGVFKKVKSNFFNLEILIVFLVFLIAFVFCAIIAKFKYEEGYLEACKDFYKGNIKYDLIENKDGTRVWKKIGR